MINAASNAIAMNKSRLRGAMMAQHKIPTEKNVIASFPIEDVQMLRPGKRIIKMANQESLRDSGYRTEHMAEKNIMINKAN